MGAAAASKLAPVFNEAEALTGVSHCEVVHPPAQERIDLEVGGGRAAVDEIIMGNVVQAGLGQNPARQAGLRGGLHPRVAAMTKIGRAHV